VCPHLEEFSRAVGGAMAGVVRARGQWNTTMRNYGDYVRRGPQCSTEVFGIREFREESRASNFDLPPVDFNVPLKARSVDRKREQDGFRHCIVLS
jgi:hypothetical protein